MNDRPLAQDFEHIVSTTKHGSKCIVHLYILVASPCLQAADKGSDKLLLCIQE